MFYCPCMQLVMRQTPVRRIRSLMHRSITKPRVILVCLSVCLTLSLALMCLRVLLTQRPDVESQTLHNSAPSVTWLNTRKTLLADSGRVSKLILYTYMRGGSSVFSQIFNINLRSSPRSTVLSPRSTVLSPRSTVLFFEPLDSFYSSFFGLQQLNLPLSFNYYNNLTRRIPSEFELSQMTQFLENVLSCNIDKLPIEMLGHRQFTLQTEIFRDMWWNCLPPREGNNSLYSCTESLARICGGRVLNHPNITEAILNRCPDMIQALKNANPGKSDKLSEVRMNVGDILGSTVVEDHVKLFLQHYRCIANLNTPIRNCWEGRGKKQCAKANLVVAKIIRASLTNLERLMERNPDIRVIYFARDPRATATSRVQNGSKLMFTQKNRNPVLEARALCTRMRDDLLTRRHLDLKYPGAILTIRYEDFIVDTERIANKVYEFVQRPLPERFNEWMQTSLNAKVDNGIFGTKRRNASALITKWRTLISPQDGATMTGYCRDVLDELGYAHT